jgi:hypothetical protein
VPRGDPGAAAQSPSRPAPRVAGDATHRDLHSCGELAKDLTAYTQLYPEKALLWAVGGGYLLRMLPITGILGALIRLVLMLVKPAALIYGVAKVWQKAIPAIAPRPTAELQSSPALPNHNNTAA